MNEEINHGYWIPSNEQRGTVEDGFWTERYLQCSACGYKRRHSWILGEKPNYCENCGTKMDKEN